MVAMAEAASVIAALSVISRPSSRGCSRLALSACATSPTRSGWWNCRAERFTATGGTARPWSSQARCCRHTARSVHSPSGSISAVSSASGMNCAGDTRPCCGWHQRTSAFAPITSPLCRLTCGW
jgi:hypothetical protein